MFFVSSLCVLCDNLPYFGLKMNSSVIFIFLISLLACSCGANESILKSGKETPVQANVEGAKSAIASDLEAMRTAGFTFIYVLRRKDGVRIDAEDRSVIKLQTTDANRRVAADEGRAVIIGTNYQIAATNMAVIYDRFAVENYSSAPSATANANSNVNK